MGAIAIRALCIDIAGVLTEDDRALPGAAETFAQLRARHVPLRVLTNTSRTPAKTVHERLQAAGFAVTEEQLLTAPLAIAALLRQRGLRAQLIVHPDVRGDFAGIREDDPQAVVVCDAGEHFTYADLDAAFRLLQAGAPLLAVGMNRYFSGGGRLQLDAGPFIRALEFAAGVQAELVGKPGAGMFLAACAAMGSAPQETLMIGDDVQADVIGAREAGLPATLVRTGKYRAGDDALARQAGANVCADFTAAIVAAGLPV